MGSRTFLAKMDKETAYYEWLGISREKHPPNHYILLRISEFEKSDQVIVNAAENVRSFLSRFAAGRYADLAHEIKKEVDRAVSVLRDPHLKEKYDFELAKEVRKSMTTTVAGSAGFSTEWNSIQDIIDNRVQSSEELSKRENWLIGWDKKKCDIIVDNKYVSAEHCVLWRVDDHFEIEDLDSRNGTYVNGDRIPPRRKVAILEKDRVTLGRRTMMPWPPIRDEDTEENG